MNKNNIVKIAILLFVFLFFTIDATGIIDFNIGQAPFVSINGQIQNDPAYFNVLLQQRILSYEFLILLLSGLLLSCMVPLISPLKGLVLGLLVLCSVIGLSYLDYQYTVLPIQYTLLTLIILYMLNVLISYMFEVQSRQKLISAFSHYVPPHLIKQLSNAPGKLALDGEWKTLSIVFCDLQDFTGISEQLNPKQLNMLLNEYFTVMTEIIFRHEGTIDKYIGDAIMSFWNAPVSQEQHAQQAVEAALDMSIAIKQLAQQFIDRGWPGPSMGIGINSGRVHVGNIGSLYRINYTAIGDAVNLASRLETLTRTYRVPIIISENTFRHLTDICCRELDIVQVKGKTRQTRIYQPLCHEADMTDSLRKKLGQHEQALELLRAGELQQAGSLFKSLYEQDKSDKYYKVMVKRIIAMAAN